MISTRESIRAAQKYLNCLPKGAVLGDFYRKSIDRDIGESYLIDNDKNIKIIQVTRNKRNIESWKAKDRLFWVKDNIMYEAINKGTFKRYCDIKPMFKCDKCGQYFDEYEYPNDPRLGSDTCFTCRKKK